MGRTGTTERRLKVARGRDEIPETSARRIEGSRQDLINMTGR
jgi:hypothetical protein